MPYIWSFLIALGVLALAVVLIFVQRRLSDERKLVAVLFIFTGGFVTNVLLSRQADADFHVTLEETLDWSYSALVMFAGAGSVDAIADLTSPSGLPVSVVQVLNYFFRVLAFLFTISAVVAALAKDTIDRLVVRVRCYQMAFEVHATTAEALLLARTLAAEEPPKGRRLLAVIAALGRDEREELDGRRMVFAKTAKSLRKRVLKSRTSAIVLADSGEPDFVDRLAAVVTELRKVPDKHDFTLHVINATPYTRDWAAGATTGFEIRAVDHAELVARDLIRVWAPCKNLQLNDGEAVEPFRALLVSDGGPVQERILEHLVMNSQFLGGIPTIHVVSTSPAEGTFRMRHPEAHLSAEINFTSVDVDSAAFYELLGNGAFHQVVIAHADQQRGLEIAHAVTTFHRVNPPPRAQQPSQQQPPQAPSVLVHADVGEVARDRVTFFGAYARIYSAANLVHEQHDREARRVNAYYDPRIKTSLPDEEFEAQAREAWRTLPALDRASSRASADFSDAMAAVSESCGGPESDEARDVVARTEHLRWNAFFRMHGYRRMPLDVMEERFTAAPGGSREDVEARGKSARVDTEELRHVCLVGWDELDAVSDAYARLARTPDGAGLKVRDFKQVDREVTELVKWRATNASRPGGA